MIPNVSQALAWLEKNPKSVFGIRRGIERETLRVTRAGDLATTPHPAVLGSALTHSWITTDFAEAMLEFITPASDSVTYTIDFLQDVHRYVARHLQDEVMWPFSMPCFINHESDIPLAYYGTSNQGLLKTVYREGLKNRYGALMQTISGVHYNFSLPEHFWSCWLGVKENTVDKQAISTGYFRLIRNYYRFGWIIPYLFGASPAICSSFINNKKSSLPFERLSNGVCFLPYATSLRMSDLGYTSQTQSKLNITFNTLDAYVAALREAMHTPSVAFSALGTVNKGKYQQLSANILQIENEYYAPIRPKRVVKKGETPSIALQRAGVEYIEVRALDINPFSAIGVDEEQIRFLDLFLIWCALAEAPAMDSKELLCARENWQRIILEGRKPGQTIGIGCSSTREPLKDNGKALFQDLMRVASVLDKNENQFSYYAVCEKLVKAFDDPELTLSARLLQQLKMDGINKVGLTLAEKYKKQLTSEPLAILNEKQCIKETEDSIKRQQKLEQADNVSFDEYIAQRIA